MSLAKLLTAPIRYFQKDVIAFLIIRRHDLSAFTITSTHSIVITVTSDKLRFISVKPTASISILRQKVWHLLDLPDYCEEIILLKTSNNVEVPLTELRKGSGPQSPFILEVWLPEKKLLPNPIHGHMLTMGVSADDTIDHSSEDSYEDKGKSNEKAYSINSSTTMENTLAPNKLRLIDNTCPVFNFVPPDFKKSDLSCRISNSSLFLRMQGKKSKDNFTNILLKIQTDLSTLSTKLARLENKMPS